MKTTIAALILVCAAGASFAQQQTAAVKMECRDVASETTLAPNETMVNGMACHVPGSERAAGARGR